MEALEPPDIEIGTRIGDHHDCVDIAGDDLFLGTFPRRLAREPRSARKHRPDHRLGPGLHVERHPIAHRRQVGVALGIVPDLPGENHLTFLTVAEDRRVVDLRFAREARRREALLTERGEGRGEFRVPSKLLERHVIAYDIMCLPRILPGVFG